MADLFSPAAALRFSLADQVLVNAIGVLLNGHRIVPDDHEAPIAALRDVLPYVSRDNPLIDELAGCADEFSRLYPNERGAAWARAAFEASDRLAQVMRVRLDGALVTWRQKGT